MFKRCNKLWGNKDNKKLNLTDKIQHFLPILVLDISPFVIFYSFCCYFFVYNKTHWIKTCSCK